VGTLLSKTPKTETPIEIIENDNFDIEKYGYTIILTKKNKTEVTDHYNKIVAIIKDFPERFITINTVNTRVKISDLVESVTYELNKKDLKIIFEKLK
jgi:hypothetical protein